MSVVILSTNIPHISERKVTTHNFVFYVFLLGGFEDLLRGDGMEENYEILRKLILLTDALENIENIKVLKELPF